MTSHKNALQKNTNGSADTKSSCNGQYQQKGKNNPTNELNILISNKIFDREKKLVFKKWPCWKEHWWSNKFRKLYKQKALQLGDIFRRQGQKRLKVNFKRNWLNRLHFPQMRLCKQQQLLDSVQQSSNAINKTKILPNEFILKRPVKRRLDAEYSAENSS